MGNHPGDLVAHPTVICFIITPLLLTPGSRSTGADPLNVVPHVNMVEPNPSVVVQPC